MMRSSDLRAKLEEIDSICNMDVPEDYKEHLTRLKGLYESELNRAIAREMANKVEPSWRNLEKSRGMWR